MISFNPRTHMGCDTIKLRKSKVLGSFNPRTHMGCDLTIVSLMRREKVSIHAPTWGATQSLLLSLSKSKFQSTHPHGVRPLSLHDASYTHCFNPRTHMGCDDLAHVGIDRNLLFQSTHPHGVRLSIFGDTSSNTCFNPRTHMGCDRMRVTKCNWILCFNPRTHMGCDYQNYFRTHHGEKFQSTHPHGVRRR